MSILLVSVEVSVNTLEEAVIILVMDVDYCSAFVKPFRSWNICTRLIEAMMMLH
jgi:hypothetical protein